MYSPSTHKNRGFTLLEMLMVIAIIGIFSAVIFTTVQTSRTKAQYAAVTQQLQEIDTAFTVWMTHGDRTDWWDETSFGLGSNPTLDDLITNTDLSKYLSAAPVPALGTEFEYDNDGDVNGGCGSSYGRGTNIVLTDVTPAIASEIDVRIDQGDGNQCGKIKWNTSQTVFFYELSDDGTF